MHWSNGTTLYILMDTSWLLNHFGQVCCELIVYCRQALYIINDWMKQWKCFRMTGVGGRPEVIVEGSSSIDGGWLEYQFQYKPGDVYRRPPVNGKLQLFTDCILAGVANPRSIFAVISNHTCYLWRSHVYCVWPTVWNLPPYLITYAIHC